MVFLLKRFSYLLIIIGIGFLAYGGYQWYESTMNQGKRLTEAQSFVSDEIIDRTNDEDLQVEYDFDTGDTIGTLYIPKLDREIAIIEGTDEEELAQGVGHFKDTGLPGENRQILLSGHRDSVFRDFGELENGDEFHIRMEHGTYVYEFRDSVIVDADDRTVIDPSRKDEFLTLSTCYPFSYIGSAPDRYVIHAYPK